MIITIDGPAGSGKSTAAKKLAEKLGYAFFDTGAMYRSITWFLIEKKVDISNEQEIKNNLKNFIFHIEVEKGKERRYFVNKKDITENIRLPEITRKVSDVSALASVRKHIVAIQRKVAGGSNAVFEGRDMGTVVFPYADSKFYLTAKAEVRAKRRFDELKEKFPELASSNDYHKILSDIIRRDEIDSTRKISPLKIASDALVINTSKLLLDKVLKKMIKKVKKNHKRQNIPRPLFFKMKPFYSFVIMVFWLFLKNVLSS